MVRGVCASSAGPVDSPPALDENEVPGAGVPAGHRLRGPSRSSVGLGGFGEQVVS